MIERRDLPTPTLVDPGYHTDASTLHLPVGDGDVLEPLSWWLDALGNPPIHVAMLGQHLHLETAGPLAGVAGDRVALVLAIGLPTGLRLGGQLPPAVSLPELRGLLAGASDAATAGAGEVEVGGEVEGSGQSVVDAPEAVAPCQG